MNNLAAFTYVNHQTVIQQRQSCAVVSISNTQESKNDLRQYK